MKIIRYAFLTALLLGLGACSDIPGLDDIDFFPGDPLLSAADLESAPLLPLAEPEAPELVLERDSKVATLQELTSAGRASQLASTNLSTLSSTELSAEGFVSYLQVFDIKYRLQLYDVAEDDTTLIYEGAHPVQSTSVTVDGGAISFVAEINGNSEVFLFDLAGDVLGSPEMLVRLTDTAFDEKDVSMSLGLAASGAFRSLLTLAWQGLLETETEEAETVFVSQIDLSTGDLVAFLPFGVNTADGLLDLREPSLSANGDIIVFLTDVGVDALGVLSLTGEAPALLLEAPEGSTFAAPSVSADATAFAALALQGADATAIYFDDESESIEVLSEAANEHPFLTAGADSFAYSDEKDIFLSELESEGSNVTRGLTYRSFGAYWAKLPPSFADSSLIYEGVNDQGPFIRLPDDGLSDEARTVLYDAKSFSVAEAGWYEIVSEQTYDGYLNLYSAPFDPKKSDVNLLVSNDDIRTAPRASGIIFELEADTEYVIVTSACGTESCGEPEGSFVNTVTPSAPPPAATPLPEPDNATFNITLRFADDEDTNSLTPEQRAVFDDAAARWSEIITGDLNSIENFSLPADPFNGFGAVEEQLLDDVLIDLKFSNIDGPAGILGRAGPGIIREKGDPDELLTIYGAMEFDISEFGEGGIFKDFELYRDVILHEMGHVIGVGTLWEAKGITEGTLDDEEVPTVNPGLPNPDYDPRFIGTGGVTEYQGFLEARNRESEASVPIANTGGPGQLNGHWRELTFDDELMTPYLGAGGILSSLTVASLGDLGYTVDLGAAEDYALALPSDFRLIVPEERTFVEFKDYLLASGSPAASISATVQAVDINLEGNRASTSGCEPEDFVDFTEGHVALVQRGTCPFVDKADNAAAAGAVGIVIFNQGDTEDRLGLISFSTTTIPGIGVSFELGAELAGFKDAEVSIDTGVEPDDVTTQALPRTGFNIGNTEILLMPEATMSEDGKLKPID